MSFLAVSLGWAIGQPVPAGQQQALWNRIERSVAVSSVANVSCGVGVLIDPSGRFLFHKSGLKGMQPWSVRIGARSLSVQFLAEDQETGLVLVKATHWDPSFGTPVRIAAAGPAKGDRVLASTPAGPRSAEVSEALVVGQVKPSLRYVPLSEVKLEDMGGAIAGSAVFNGRAELIGMISAFQVEAGRGGSNFSASPKTADANLKVLLFDSSQVFGPGSLTVGYAFGPSLVERICSGLSSPAGRVQHPSIGIYFKQSPDGGASLEAVMPTSKAEEAGLKVGDVVVEAEGQKVRGPVDLAVVLFNQRIGGQLRLKIRRGQQVMDVTVVVGVQDSDESLRSSILQRKSERP